MLVDNIKHKINTKTKPLGALGVLEKIALQLVPFKIPFRLS
jgi:NaMN:DMB phosphoribosyltransferase